MNQSQHNERRFLVRLLRRADQFALGLLTLLSLLAMIGYWLANGGHQDRMIEIESAPKQTADFIVDINQADWPELTLLPGIGEVKARAIVRSREQGGPFVDHGDLERVHGIGPKTLENIRPYLLPIPDHENVASQ